MGSTEKIYNNPLHPYTRMLMASVPRLDRKWDEEPVSSLLKTDPADLAAGCVYYNRCPIGDEKCTKDNPHLVEVESDHFVACSRYNQEQ